MEIDEADAIYDANLAHLNNFERVEPPRTPRSRAPAADAEAQVVLPGGQARRARRRRHERDGRDRRCRARPAARRRRRRLRDDQLLGDHERLYSVRGAMISGSH